MNYSKYSIVSLFSRMQATKLHEFAPKIDWTQTKNKTELQTNIFYECIMRFAPTRNSIIQHKRHRTSYKHGSCKQNVQHLIYLHYTYDGRKNKDAHIVPQDANVTVSHQSMYVCICVCASTSDQGVFFEVAGQDQAEEDGEAKDKQVAGRVKIHKLQVGKANGGDHAE